MTPVAQHDELWSDRLQDWRDGDLAGADAASVEAHISNCELCRAQLAAFEQLDAALRRAAPNAVLSAEFDMRLFTRINAMDDDASAAARERLSRELRENLALLSRGWHLALALVIPGVVAGFALALALMGYFDSIGITQQLAQHSALGVGNETAAYVHMLAMACIGAGVGVCVARWLSFTAD